MFKSSWGGIPRKQGLELGGNTVEYEETPGFRPMVKVSTILADSLNPIRFDPSVRLSSKKGNS